MSDECGRKILNVLICELKKDSRSSEYLMESFFVDDSRSGTLSTKIISILNQVTNNNSNQYKRCLMTTTDRAPNAVACGKLLKQIIPSVKHVTCLCHALHNLCEVIRNSNSHLNDFASFLKKY